MKTYLRVLSFAKPLVRFIPPYAVFSVLAIIFGLINFTLIIPVLNVLFGTLEMELKTSLPEFHFSVNYFIDLFKYHFSNVLAANGKFGALSFVCAIIFAAVIVTNLFRYLSQRVMSAMRAHVVSQMRLSLFDKITRLDFDFFHHQRKGDLLSNLSNDIGEVENSVVSSIQVIFREPLMIIGYMTLLFFLSAKLTLFTFLVIPVSGLIISLISKKLRKDAKQGQHLLGNLLSVIEETLSGIRIIKAFNAEKYTLDKFQTNNEGYRKMMKSMWNRKELASPLSEVLGVGMVVGVLVYGGKLVLENHSELSASEFITYIALYSQILVPAKNISNAITSIQRGLIAADRVFKVIDEPITIEDSKDAIPVRDFNHNIEYRNVSFSYLKASEGKVLQNINLKIEKGKTVALVGQSGSGKTTLADLLPRFYDLKDGEILLDGENIRDYRLHDLRGLMGIVTQESILFNDTVFNNIAFAVNGAKEEDVIEAAKIANAHNFIMEMKDGYQTNIGDRGSKMSGGQKQRISIARAIFKNPPILILDEATSALDTESERLVQDALIHLMKNRTTLVIAHRLSTIQHADEIIVMQQGEIVERGKHEVLLAKGGIYKKLFDLQSFV